MELNSGDEVNRENTPDVDMAESYSRLKAFDPDKGNWESYQERLEQLFVVNKGKADDREGRRVALLTVCGKETYDLLKTLCAPKKPAKESYDTLCKRLCNHFNLKSSEILQRAPGESVLDDVAALRKLANDCKYGDKLEKNLRDRLVCGINQPAIQRKLLSESALDLQKAVKVATAMEATDRHLAQLPAANAAAENKRTLQANDVKITRRECSHRARDGQQRPAADFDTGGDNSRKCYR